jgi:AcrR family transcriptional regulator
MPRTHQQNEALRADTRARIMEAALLLFGEYGYESTSVRLIAQRAGVAQGLLYSHFASKDELLAAIFHQSMHDVRASFALAEEAEPAGERIAALVRAAFTIVRRNQHFWRLSYGARMQPAVLAALSDDLQGWTAEIQRTLVRYFEETGVAEPQIEAALLFALIDGVSQHYVLDPEHYPLDAVTEAIIERYRAKERTDEAN